MTLPVAVGDVRSEAWFDAWLAEYGFLAGYLVDPEALIDARQYALDVGISVHEALIARGLAAPLDYAGALAHALGLDLIGLDRVGELAIRPSQSAAHPYDAILCHGAERTLVLDGLARRPHEIHHIVRTLREQGIAVALTAPEVLRATVIARRGRAILEEAVHGLAHREPKNSAAAGLATWQMLALAGVTGLILGASLVVPVPVLIVTTGLLSLPFLFVVALRLLALRYGLRSGAPRRKARRRRATDLPVYTLLVPLYQETRVLPGLIGALRALDYPAAKLDIKIILESVDGETIRAVERLALGPPFDVIIVPDHQPRTKPKALNYALQFARGDFVVIFDAEDLPEPRQLKEALAAFDAEPVELGCVQGRLVIDNAGAGWIARQFAIEYLALFDGLLPAFERMGVPIPLGGTSNHFRTKTLRDVGGWDAFNVTEDADLGMRLARCGHRCRVIAARTYEEAPFRLGGWIRQRTRWLKGWMQTYSVHMRQPRTLLAELGPWRFVGFQAVFGGMILSALVHPLFYMTLLAHALLGNAGIPALAAVGDVIQHIAIVNLVAGYGAAMLLAAVCIIRRRQWRLLPHVLLMPVYWLLISIAAYRAIPQLLRDPFLWEKTEHGLSAREDRVSGEQLRYRAGR